MCGSYEPNWQRLALDAQAQLEERIAAIVNLGSSGSRSAAQPLLDLGGRDGESPEILRATGNALAALANSGVSITEFDLRDVQGATYEAFCDWHE